VLVLRLMFVLLVRCPAWARPGSGPVEVVGSLIDMLDSVLHTHLTMGLPWASAHGTVALPAEILKVRTQPLLSSPSLRHFLIFVVVGGTHTHTLLLPSRNHVGAHITISFFSLFATPI
jgi:hypothetical protein